MAKPKFTKRWSTDPIWRCGVLEIRDVKKNGGEFARNGYDPAFRYNMWVGTDMGVINVSDGLRDLQQWALTHYEPTTGKEI